MDRDGDLAFHLKTGQDPVFDKLIRSIGSIAKHSPKLIIDSIIVWRKTKTQSQSETKYLSGELVVAGKDIDAALQEKRLLVANCILCKVLLEIVANLNKDTLSVELGDKLEEMLFGQVKNADPDSTAKHLNRQANLDFFSEVIGSISRLRFNSVSYRFVNELTKSGLMRESKIELLIRCMRFIKLKIYPMDCLEETTEFLQVEFMHNVLKLIVRFVENFFKMRTIQKLNKHTQMFLPIITAEVNLPAWMKTIELIYPKASKLCAKPRNALEKNFRHVAVTAVVKQVWVYLFRSPDVSASHSQKRIESIISNIDEPVH
ncbi:Cell morphogenesis protein PAG1 [Clydaea vesicula]|uniref:Cell morphogenesis protein PAG1 n=1 Tax=Clydaea vesicula TaxID=447962 RepID=A0AAD5XXC3_9FUNG|nr:Cell morphogenesis protein PAG1 [Clydaea vesicula]